MSAALSSFLQKQKTLDVYHGIGQNSRCLDKCARRPSRSNKAQKRYVMAMSAENVKRQCYVEGAV
jgi:hypothetical protein